MINFNLEAFKAGQKAMYIGGKDVISFLATTRIGRVVYEYSDNAIGFNFPADMAHSYEMVSRHQALIDAYDPEDTWQWKPMGAEKWDIVVTAPTWDEETDFRLHPHNSLIKAHKKGAKIEKLCDDVWEEVVPLWYEDAIYRIKPEPEPEPEFVYPIYKQAKNNDVVIKFTGLYSGEVISTGSSDHLLGDTSYRWIEHTRDHWKDWTPPQTKTVYEWLYKNHNDVWILSDILRTEDEAKELFAREECLRKTGRSWEVEV